MIHGPTDDFYKETITRPWKSFDVTTSELPRLGFALQWKEDP